MQGISPTIQIEDALCDLIQDESGQVLEVCLRIQQRIRLCFSAVVNVQNMSKPKNFLECPIAAIRHSLNQ